MNKNDLLRSKKEKSIKSAIQHLYNEGHIKFTKKLIADTTKQLSPNDLDSQISTNTLSKVTYYKRNIKDWIEEITSIKKPHLKKARENALKSRKKSAHRNYKEIEKQAIEIVNLVLLRELECKKFTKKFLTEQLKRVNGKNGLKVNDSTLSQDFYAPIHEKALNILHQNNITEIDKGECISSDPQLVVLRTEIKRLKTLNANLIKGLFTMEEDEIDRIHSIHRSSDFTSVTLDKDLVYSYMTLFKDKMKRDIDAVQFFNQLIEYCKKNKGEKS